MANDLPPSSAPPLGMGLRLNLSVMMFLQFAVWGAWFTVLNNYLEHLGFSKWLGSIFGTMALGSIIAPLIFGQIADRFVPSQWLMAILHLAGAAALYWMAQITPASIAAEMGVEKVTAEIVETAANRFWYAAFVYALIYSPTLALANTIAFAHVPNGQRDFPGVRTFGTIGWIVAGIMVGKLIPKLGGLLAPVLNVPEADFLDPKITNLPFILAAALSAMLGVWSLFLPHTPPRGQAGDAIPFLKAFGLLREPSFAVFFGVSFIITIALAFYYGFAGLWLGKKIGVKDVASIMTIGQWSEMFILPFLPWFLRRFGMKGVLLLGMFAWGARYAWFARATPNPMSLGFELPFGLGDTIDWGIILPLALHGLCFDFFFAAGFIHVDNEAPANIRGSAQALFTFLTYGLGMWLGNLLSGKLYFAFSNDYLPEPGWRGKLKMMFANIPADSTDLQKVDTDWTTFWTIPSIGVFVSMAVFLLFFRMRKRTNP